MMFNQCSESCAKQVNMVEESSMEPREALASLPWQVEAPPKPAVQLEVHNQVLSWHIMAIISNPLNIRFHDKIPWFGKDEDDEGDPQNWKMLEIFQGPATTQCRWQGGWIQISSDRAASPATNQCRWQGGCIQIYSDRAAFGYILLLYPPWAFRWLDSIYRGSHWWLFHQPSRSRQITREEMGCVCLCHLRLLA